MNRDAPQLDGSGLARIGQSDLYAQGRQLYARLIEKSPQDATLWVRLGDLERSDGHLERARDCYRQAAQFEPENPAHASLVALLDGDPYPLCTCPNGVAEPFLLDTLPLPEDLVRALVAAAPPSQSDLEDRANVVDQGEPAYRPEIRQALSRHVPKDLREQVAACFAPFARRAAEALFARPQPLGALASDLLNYRSGGGYTAHRDRAPASSPRFSARVLSILAYLDVTEDAFSGGDLLIHDRSGTGVTRLRPRTGLVVAFPSDAVHEVTALEAHHSAAPCNRITLVLWYDEAPAGSGD